MSYNNYNNYKGSPVYEKIGFIKINHHFITYTGSKKSSLPKNQTIINQLHNHVNLRLFLEL